MISVLLIKYEEGHLPRVPFLESIAHQELCLAHNLDLLWILWVLLDDLQDEALHGDRDARPRLVTQELEPGEPKFLPHFVIDGPFLLHDKRGDFAHHKLINAQIEVLLLHLSAFVVELSGCLEADLLELVLFSLLSLHSHLEDLAFVRVKWLVSDGAAQHKQQCCYVM